MIGLTFKGDASVEIMEGLKRERKAKYLYDCDIEHFGQIIA